MPVCSCLPLAYPADPTVYFERLLSAPDAILLDSGQPGSRGRFDILSAAPAAILTPKPEESAQDFWQRCRIALRTLGTADAPPGLDLPFCGGLLGYTSYDLAYRMHPLGNQAHADSQLATARLGLYRWALITDHHQKTCHLVFHPKSPAAERQHITGLFKTTQPLAAPQFQLEQPFEAAQPFSDYAQAFARIQAYIRAGDCYQVNFAQSFHSSYSGSTWRAYQRLRQHCPTPFAAYLALPDGDAILSLSPERFLAVQDGQVETRPIKGTRPRSADPQQDTAYRSELLSSPKDRAENLMIVDLLRNDLGRHCRIGSIQTPELFQVETYPNVHHLVSCITGELAPGSDPGHLFLDAFPGGSITGAPKIRAMQIIDELEPVRRSLYCGSILYWDVRDRLDSSITIRTLICEQGRIRCWGGGGIVADSVLESEYQESLDKVRILLRTLEASKA